MFKTVTDKLKFKLFYVISDKLKKFVPHYFQTTFKGHSDYVHAVCLKNSGRECISGSEDGTVRIWGKDIIQSESLNRQCQSDIYTYSKHLHIEAPANPALTSKV